MMALLDAELNRHYRMAKSSAKSLAFLALLLDRSSACKGRFVVDRAPLSAAVDPDGSTCRLRSKQKREEDESN